VGSNPEMPKAEPVRSFPRTARRRWAAAVAACALAAGALTVPLAHAEDLKHKQRSVHKKVESAHDDLEQSSATARRATARLEAAKAELAGARDHLMLVRARLDAAQARDDAMQRKLEDAVERLERAEAELADGRVALTEQQDEVSDVVSSIYQNGDPELVAFTSLLNAQSPSDLTRQIEANNVLVEGETQVYDELRAAEVLLEVREQQVEEARDEVARQRQAAAEHLVEMQELRDQALEAEQAVEVLVADRREANEEASRARRQDQAVLDELRREEERIKRMILVQARKAARAKGGFDGATGGFLDRPVPGIVTSPFGWRTHPIYGYWGLHNGTDFRAGCGEPLRASASGRVITRYYSSVYGNRLYLGVGMVNGKFITVVYNHLSGYTVGTGQNVSRGQVIGYGGTTGWSTACHLHYTVLANGVPVNPMNYM
jgi:murein DD-endopeptidase MepM/ murein hydrolase activator NlpD